MVKTTSVLHGDGMIVTIAPACAAICENDEQCKNKAKNGTPYCGRHPDGGKEKKAAAQAAPAKAAKKKAAAAVADTPKCKAIKKDHERCTFNAQEGSDYCGRHPNGGLEVASAQATAQAAPTKKKAAAVADTPKCKAIKKDHKRCTFNAQEGSDYCGRHPDGGLEVAPAQAAPAKKKAAVQVQAEASGGAARSPARKKTSTLTDPLTIAQVEVDGLVSFLGMNLEELKEHAKNLGISGCSRMNKEAVLDRLYWHYLTHADVGYTLKLKAKALRIMANTFDIEGRSDMEPNDMREEVAEHLRKSSKKKLREIGQELEVADYSVMELEDLRKHVAAAMFK
jgi:hypothetical protein